MALTEATRVIEGFQFNSYSQELVAQILVAYMAGNSYEKIPLIIPGTASAQAHRIVVEAVKRGVIPPEAARPKGRPSTPLNSAIAAQSRHLDARAVEVAKIAGCGEATAYRARKIVFSREQ